MLRSLHLSKQLAIHIHALNAFENVLQRLNFPVKARSLTSLIPGKKFHCVRQFTVEDVEAFLKITGDANSIHTDSAAAAAAGLQAPILPGIMMASLFPAIIGTNFPGAIYASQTLKFRQPAEVGKTTGCLFLLSSLPNCFYTRFKPPIYFISIQIGSWIRATVRLENLKGSRASFATECVLLPTPSIQTSDMDSTGTLQPESSPVLLEGQALALLKNI